jgi:hypothetical protein
MKSSFLTLFVRIDSSMMEVTHVDKDSSLVVDCLKIELNLIVVPFSRNVKFGPEPRVLD